MAVARVNEGSHILKKCVIPREHVPLPYLSAYARYTLPVFVGRVHVTGRVRAVRGP